MKTDEDSITNEPAASLAAALATGRWFAHALWRGNGLEPFAFRWVHNRLERARRDDLLDSKISERRFSPLEVLSTQWRFVHG
jgi:hypothetical protein